METLKPLIDLMSLKPEQAILCLRSRNPLFRTGQCFLLNGLIFLGRYNDIAAYGLEAIEKPDTSSVEALRQGEAPASTNMANADRPSGLGGVMIGIREQVYSVILSTVFFLEVYTIGYLPYVGKEALVLWPFSFSVLLSAVHLWPYAVLLQMSC